MRSVSLMGSSGSVGTQALDVIRAEPQRFRVHALAANRSADVLVAQAAEFHPDVVVIGDPTLYGGRARRRTSPASRSWPARRAWSQPPRGADVVLNAVVGFAGLPVTMAALEAGRRLALANKESLIAGAPVVQKARSTPGAEIVPVDSEHCALHQCLASVPGTTDVARLLLTASGGPFRDWPADKLGTATVQDALAHPTWSMGPKITIDSSTLMNKGLEVIEAHELFGIDYDRIDIVVHPQSIVHSMVELRDGSTLAQLSAPDMRLPIGYALGWPDRIATSYGALDWSAPRTLTFEAPDRSMFRCIDLAYDAGRRGGSAPAWLERRQRGGGRGVSRAAACRGWASPRWWTRRSRPGSTIMSTRWKGCWRQTPRPAAGPPRSSPADCPAEGGGSVEGAMTLIQQVAASSQRGAEPSPEPQGSAGERRQAADRSGRDHGPVPAAGLGCAPALHRDPHRDRDAARAGPLRHGQVGGHEGHRVLRRLRASPVVDPPGRDRVRREGDSRRRVRPHHRVHRRWRRSPRRTSRGPTASSPSSKRIIVASAGSVMHLLIAFVLALIVVFAFGKPTNNYKVAALEHWPRADDTGGAGRTEGGRHDRLHQRQDLRQPERHDRRRQGLDRQGADARCGARRPPHPPRRRHRRAARGSRSTARSSPTAATSASASSDRRSSVSALRTPGAAVSHHVVR